MKALAGSIAVALVLVVACGTGRSEPLTVRTSAVDLHAADDRINRIGRLKFEGGLILTSADPRFGGLSGLAVSADGRLLSAVSDRGDWVHFRPILDAIGRLTGMAAAQIGRLKNLDGNPLRGKRYSDAESLTSIDGGFVVSFEHRHRLWLYRGGLNPLQARPMEIALPARARTLPANKGLEALARLCDERLIAIAEDFPKDASFAQGWIFDNNRSYEFRYRRHARFLAAGAATLPDGTLVVLERRFSYIGGFGTRLVAVSPDSIKPGSEISGHELARLELPLITENFEGIAAHRNAAGDTVLYLISDDNFSVLQQTILLKFVLKE